MIDVTRTHSRLWSVTLICLISLLFGCGDTSINGGGIGGTGKTPTIEDDGLILGKVGGFGSIVINDQRFDTTDAEFIVDGKEASITDIQIGMNIGARVNFTTMLATQVRYQPLVTGPIESSEDMQSTLSILGQSILITPQTALDGLTPDALQSGLVLEVSGTRDSNQSIVADYITIATTNTPFYTVGVVNQIRPESNTALLSGTVINYLPVTDETQVSSNQLDQLKPGNRVRVAVPELQPNTPQIVDTTQNVTQEKTSQELTVTDVVTVKEFEYTRGSRVEISGRINTFSSDGAFIVNGVTVYADVTTKVYSKFGILIENPVLKNNESAVLDGIAIGPRRITAREITLLDRL